MTDGVVGSRQAYELHEDMAMNDMICGPANRDAVRQDFLARAGWRAPLRKLAGDASPRQYYRVLAPDRPAILMDAPPPQDVAAFMRVDRLLCGHGFSAPKILAADPAHGLLLLEDFG